MSRQALARRLAAVDWPALRQQVDAEGFGLVPGLLNAASCTALRAVYAEPERFRSRVVMERYGYGRGEYRYFNYPLPPLVQHLRELVYLELAPLANVWAERLNEAHRYPADFESFRTQCHAAGQTRPTPLLLRYAAGDYNCLHQDVYGALHFPLQMITALCQAGEDYHGGELILVEQRPRRQSRPRVIALQRGDAVVTAVRFRPEPGPRGYRRVAVRHGVSTVHGGERYTLGVIFHDAE